VEYKVDKSKRIMSTTPVLDAAVDGIQHQNNEENSQSVAGGSKHPSYQ